jgi:hypothetical protein
MEKYDNGYDEMDFLATLGQKSCWNYDESYFRDIKDEEEVETEKEEEMENLNEVVAEKK